MVGHGKFAHIGTHGVIILRHVGRIGGKGVTCVRVDGGIEPLQFPAARHLDGAPATGAVPLTVKVGRMLGLVLCVVESPCAVQRDAAFGLGGNLEAALRWQGTLLQGVCLVNIRDEMGMHRLALQLVDLRVLPRLTVGPQRGCTQQSHQQYG